LTVIAFLWQALGERAGLDWTGLDWTEVSVTPVFIGTKHTASSQSDETSVIQLMLRK
jgi:hypothetical protein